MTNIHALSYDVLIVGAGPAGLAAAVTSAKHGARVLVIEKSSEIGYPVHTSGASWISEMREFDIPPNYYNPIRNCIFLSPHNKVEFRFKKDMACVLDVRKVYQYMAYQAAAFGCDILLQTVAKQAIVEDNFVKGAKALRGGEIINILAKVSIDASGFSAVLAREVGLLNHWNRYAVGAEYEAYVENLDKHTSILLVGNDISPSGYAWIFPVADNRARIGVGFFKPMIKPHPKFLLDKLIEEGPSVIKQLGKITPIEYHYGLIPAQGPIKKSVYNGLILVGDSAGQPAPLVGEGIRFAIKFGKLAGKAALKAIKVNDTSELQLQEYDKKWRKQVGKNFSIALKVQQRLSTYSDQKWDEGVEKLKVLKPSEFAQFLRCDFSLSTIMKILARKPILATSTTLNLLLRGLRSQRQ